MPHFVAVVRCEQIMFTTVFKHHPRKVLVSFRKKLFFDFTYPLKMYLPIISVCTMLRGEKGNKPFFC